MDTTGDSIVTIGTFISYMTYYIKMGIYANKGTDNDLLLERCIKLYNKYTKLESSPTISSEDEICVRKCLKRLNLVLKIEDDDNIEIKKCDIQNKSNQAKILELQPHPSLESNNLNEMMEFLEENPIDIFTNIPLTFVLKPGKYQEIIWQYTRALFYISQLVLSKVREGTDPSTPSFILKNKIYDESLLAFGSILEKIESMEECGEMNKLMALDNFLKKKLLKSGLSQENVGTAKDEVKEIFQRKGLGNNPAMNKMIDTISDKLVNFDASEGNIVQSMFSMAQSVAEEMRPELESDPEAFQNTLGSVTEIFRDMMQNADQEGNQMPAEFKEIATLATSMMSNDPNAPPPGSDELYSLLERMISANGLDREAFYNSMSGGNGELDMSKLQSFLSTM
jgi:hypothetical protein